MGRRVTSGGPATGRGRKRSDGGVGLQYLRRVMQGEI